MTQNRIREHRERLGWSQERLGKATGTTGQQISRLENSVRRLSDPWMEKLATALSVRKRDLLVDIRESSHQLPGDRALDDVERALLLLWRRLSPDEKKVVISMVRGWATEVLDDHTANGLFPPNARRKS